MAFSKSNEPTKQAIWSEESWEDQQLLLWIQVKCMRAGMFLIPACYIDGQDMSQLLCVHIGQQSDNCNCNGYCEFDTDCNVVVQESIGKQEHL